MSITSGTEICMRKASSYWAMRVSVSGWPSSWAWIWFKSRSASRLSRRHVAVHARGVGNVQHRIALRAALHALVHGRQEAAAERVLAAVGLHAAGDQDHEARQVLVLRAQTVGDPRAQRGTAGAGRAGVHQQFGRRVVELVGVHRVDDAHLVGDGVQVRDRVGHPEPALAVLSELPRRAQQLGRPGGEGKPLALQEFVGARLAVAA